MNHDPNPTPRQTELLQHMADGKVLAEIAQEMGLTPLTVQSYKKIVRMRMRAATSEQAVAAALRRGLID